MQFGVHMNIWEIIEVYWKQKNKKKRGYTLAHRARNSCTVAGPAHQLGRVHRSPATSKTPAWKGATARGRRAGRSRLHLNGWAWPPGSLTCEPLPQGHPLPPAPASKGLDAAAARRGKLVPGGRGHLWPGRGHRRAPRGAARRGSPLGRQGRSRSTTCTWPWRRPRRALVERTPRGTGRSGEGSGSSAGLLRFSLWPRKKRRSPGSPAPGRVRRRPRRPWRGKEATGGGVGWSKRVRRGRGSTSEP